MASNMFTINSLNHTNFRNLSIHKSGTSPYFIQDYYHKFLISKGMTLGEEKVYTKLLYLSQSSMIVPFKWSVQNNSDICFLATGCFGTVKSLIGLGMVLEIDSHLLQVEVSVNCLETCQQAAEFNNVLRTSMMKRYNASLSAIDLSYFGHEESFSATWFCRMWVPVVRRNVLSNVKSYLNIRILNLAHNDLIALNFLVPLVSLDKLQVLDLSYNKLTWEGFRTCPAFNIRSLYIEGNPLCSMVSPAQCVTRITIILPSITELDGCQIGEMECGTAFLMRTYLGTNDASWITDQFLRHYFNYFQGNRRKDLIAMYRNDALISISAAFIPNQVTSDSVGINNFIKMGRNILKATDYWKVKDSFQQGHGNVIGVLQSLPFLTVDRFSACVDVPYYKHNECIMINIMCVVKDQDLNDYCMDSTFVLITTPQSLGEWQICNHMMVFTNATTQQAEKAFLESDCSLNSIIDYPFDYSNEEKLAIFSEKTTMKIDSCRKFLEDARWNLENAFHTFVDLYKGGQITASAFM